MEITPDFAEVCGMHAGDGHLHKNQRQFEISGHIEEKDYYDKSVIPLFNKFFEKPVKGRFFPTKKTYGFYKAGSSFPLKLNCFGFPFGSKKLIVGIPKQIRGSKNLEIKKRFLRGYFDTDGCVTFDRKFKNSKNSYPRIILTSISNFLIDDVCALLKEFDFRFYVVRRKREKLWNDLHAIYLVGINQIEKWFKEIGSKNHCKHSRYLIWKKFGFCPPFTNYQERKNILSGKLDPSSLY